MIETLARKRTNAVALAVLAALVAALFVALQPISAANCALNPGLTLGTGENCDIDVAELNEDATGLAEVVPDGESAILTIAATTPTDDPDTNFNILAGTTPGTRTVNLTAPDGTNLPDDADSDADVVGSIEVTVAGFGIRSLTVKGDSDNVVSAGPQVTVVAKLVSSVTGSPGSAVRLTVPTTGLSIETDATTGATSQSQTKNVTTGGTEDVEFVVNTAGAPAGDYTLTFTADQDGDFATKDNSDEANKQTIQTLTLTIGDPGTGLASATLSLGNSAEDLPFTDANEAVAETGSAAASDGSINLVVEVFDSLGGKANTGAIDQIIVIAPGGTIASSHLTGADATTTAGGSSSATLNEQDATTGDPPAGDVGQRTQISVSKADKKPGQVTVYAIVSGPGGAARTEDVTLTFSGPAASMSIADATESLLSVNVDGDDENDTVDPDEYDTIKLVVTAADAGGNTTAPPTGNVSIVITDPDGKRQGTSVIGRSQPTKEGAKYLITLTGKGTATAPLAAGTWTLTATSGKLEATASFAVAGAPADVAVSASQTSSDTIGDVVTVTATVTDKDGNTVSDGTMVMFSVSGDTGLAAIGTGHKGKATKNGEASVKFAVVRAGHSVVSAEAGDATGVVVISSTAGSPPVVEVEPDPALASISVEVVGEDHSAGRITVLASLADADGNAVEGMVSFYSSGDASLFGPTSVVTSDGTATAVYDANDDFTVLAISGGLRESVNIEVTSAAEQAAADQAEADRIAAEEAAAQAERDRIAAEEAAAEAAAEAEAAAAAAAAAAAELAAEVERLSGMTGFASWLSEQTISGSELFSALSENGATAIHLWNGTSWVRYSVVDGAEVPGSVDFMVNLGNVLYISN